VDLLFTHQPDEDNTPNTSRVRPVLIAGNEQIVGLSFSLRAPRGNAFGGLADFLGGGADRQVLRRRRSSSRWSSSRRVARATPPFMEQMRDVSRVERIVHG
jgi:hypothetical protein